MVCWSGYTLLVAGVDAAVAEATPLPLTALAAVSGVVLVGALAMSLAGGVTRARARSSGC